MIKYIYTISDPETNLVFYVGATVDIEQRAKIHMNPNILTTCVFEIQRIVKNKMKPIFTLVSKCNENWREEERLFILKMINEGQPILNRQIKGYKNKDYGFDIVNLT